MRRAQTYTLDLIVALSMIVLLVSFLATVSWTPSRSRVSADAKALASITHNPYPSSWNATTVIIPGFVRDNRFNASLFTNFSSLSQEEVWNLTGIASDYYITVHDNETTLGVAGTPVDVNATNVAVVRRYAAYDGTIVTIEVIAWE